VGSARSQQPLTSSCFVGLKNRVFQTPFFFSPLYSKKRLIPPSPCGGSRDKVFSPDVFTEIRFGDGLRVVPNKEASFFLTAFRRSTSDGPIASAVDPTCLTVFTGKSLPPPLQDSA